MSSPQELAKDVCQILSARYPDDDYEFDHGDAEEFFETYYDIGLPFDPLEGFTSVWFQEGELIHWTAPFPYFWDNSCFNFTGPEGESEQDVYQNFLFIHTDGSVSVVDDHDGRTCRLLRKPSARELVAYAELFFKAGRERQRAIAQGTAAAITGVNVPFFHFPDDFSEDLTRMPVVPFQHLKDTIFRHVAEHQPWLFAMNDHTACLKRMEKNIETRESEANIRGKEPTSNIQIEMETEDGAQSFTGEEFVYGMIAGAQEAIEKARPQLMADAANIPPEAFNWNWQEDNHHTWGHPFSHLADDAPASEEYLPLCLQLSGSVFSPFLNPTYCRAAYQQVFKALIAYIKSIENDHGSIPLDLPDYHEQVLNCFLQEACLTQGPELATEALEARPDSAVEHTENLKRRLNIIKHLK